MKVIVCVKQVPDTKGGVQFNPDGTLNRAAMLTIMNPDDKAGLEAALRLKDQYGAEVTVVTMGLPKAADVLQEAMIGLLKAINAYDETKNASFTTFAILCIKRQIITAIKSSNSGKNKILNMAMYSPETEDNSNIAYETKSFNFYNPEEIYLSKERFRLLNQYLKNNLSKMENEIFEYMLSEMTYTEIAKKTGRDPKSVDNSIQRIKKKLNGFLKEYDRIQ